MGQTYSSQPDRYIISEKGKLSSFVFAAASVQGWRKNQEDRYKTCINLWNNLSYFAVFDGHGGFEIAEWVKENLHSILRTNLLLNEDIELVLNQSFMECDDWLRSSYVMVELKEMLEEVRNPLLDILSAGFPEDELQGQNSEVPGPSSSQNLPTLSAARGAGFAPSLNKEFVGKEILKGVAATKIDSTASAAMTTSNCDKNEEALADVKSSDYKPENSNTIDYLLHGELASSSDSEDSDFEISSQSFSEGSDEEMPFPDVSVLTAEPGDLSGTTATVVLLGNNKLYMANVGDSRCVLSRNGIALDISLDHNLDDSNERERVLNAGAKISSDGRINNTINISRAFGDFHLKKHTGLPFESPVTAIPFIKTVDVEEQDDFVILASDGIWNSLSSQEVVDFVNQRIRDKDGSLIHICEELFKLIMPDQITEDGTGCDNMTMIIIKLNTNEEHNYLVDDIGTEEMEVCSTHSDSTE